MKNKIFFSIVQIILWLFLSAGLFLLWVFSQPFEAIASLLNTFASDGEFESFTVSLHQTLKLPLALIAVVLVSFTGSMLVWWKKTKTLIQDFCVWAKSFPKKLYKDTQNFFGDAQTELSSQGWVVNTILLVLMFVALVLRLENLDIPFGHDESYMYNAFVSRSGWHLLSNYHLPNNHVFLSLVLHITLRLFGNEVWILRLPTIITGVFMTPVAYFFAKRFYGKETAVLSSIFVAIYPVLVGYSVVARGYIIIAFITLLLFIFADYVRVKKNRFAWLLIALFSTIGFFTIPIMLFPFGGVFIWLLVSNVIDDTRSYGSKTDFLRYWVGSGISAAIFTIVLYAPILLNNFERFFGNSFVAPLEWDVFPATIYIRLRNTWIEWTSSVPLGIALIFVLGLCISIMYHKRLSGQKFSLQLAFFIWIFVVVIARRPNMLPRFWLFLAAPLLIWSTAGIVEPIKRISLKIYRGRNLAQIFVSIIFVFVVVQSLLSLPSLPVQLEKKDSLERVAIFMKDYIQPGDLVTANVPWLPSLRYYFNYYEITRGTIRQTGEFQRAFVVVNVETGETLQSVSPKKGFDIPVVDIDTAKILLQFEDYTVYECYPAE